MVEQLDLFKITEEDLQEIHDNKTTEKKLTPRQWKLYNLVKSNSEQGLKTTQREIFEKVDGYVWNDEITCHDHCVVINSDVRAINLSPRTEKLICYKNFEYWLGTKEESKEFIDDLWQQLIPRLTRYWFYVNKLKEDGQGKLLSKALKPIDATSDAREFVESYLRR